LIDLVAFVYNRACRLCFTNAKPMAGGCCSADGQCAMKQRPDQLAAEKKAAALEAGVITDTN
jgi:hypothetical protein